MAPSGGTSGKIEARGLPSAAHALSRKQFAPHNILVGDDPAHVRLFEHIFGREARPADRVEDETLLGFEPALLRVRSAAAIDLSADVRARTGLWSAAPVEADSAALNALVRHAAALVSASPSKERIASVGRALASRPAGVGDLRGALWEAAALLAAPPGPAEAPPPREPWEGRGWLPPGVDPESRLRSLHETVARYAYIWTGQAASARAFGASAAERDKLSGLVLPLDRVYKTLRELSAPRPRPGDAWRAALKISSVWAR